MAVEECVEGSEHLFFEVVLDRLVRHPVQHLRSIRQQTPAYVSLVVHDAVQHVRFVVDT
jgi:hypothetical protein